MFSLGGQEILILAVVALLLFGPDKIPQLARTIGRFTREFNKYKSIMESTLQQEFYNLEGPKTDTTTVEERMNKAAGASMSLIAEENSASAGILAGGAEEAAESVSPETAAAAAASAALKPLAIVTDEGDEEDEG